jgi:topoisomerase-4 subunit A
MEKILYGSLEKIFIENRIYRDIEEAETFEAVIDLIDKGLEPYKQDFYREITREDILRLTEIRIKRISKFDSFKADELMKRHEDNLKEVNHNLENIIDYTIDFYKNLIKKYGENRPRRTEIREFGEVQAKVVAANNQKLYVDRKNGFIGYGLKKEEYVMDCSDIDDIIIFKKDGTSASPFSLSEKYSIFDFGVPVVTLYSLSLVILVTLNRFAKVLPDLPSR